MENNKIIKKIKKKKIDFVLERGGREGKEREKELFCDGERIKKKVEKNMIKRVF